MNKKKILVITEVKHINNLTNELNKIGKVTYLDNPNFNQVKKIINNYDVIFTNPNKSKIYIGKKLLENSKLEVVCTASTGLNHINVNYLKKRKIKIISLTKEKKITNKISSTAEMALALTLSSLRNVVTSSKSVLQGTWDYTKFIGRQFDAMNVGIIGYGRLGKMYAKYCKALGAKIIVYDPYVKQKKNYFTQNLNNLLKKSDIISLHIHLSEKNKNIINFKKLSLMKSNVLIVNTSRGELINENDIIKFLKKNPNAKLATDVVSNEILKRKSNLLIKNAKKNNQIMITPHIGGMTVEAQDFAYKGVTRLLKKFLKKWKFLYYFKSVHTLYAIKAHYKLSQNRNLTF